MLLENVDGMDDDESRHQDTHTYTHTHKIEADYTKFLVRQLGELLLGCCRFSCDCLHKTKREQTLGTFPSQMQMALDCVCVWLTSFSNESHIRYKCVCVCLLCVCLTREKSIA